MQGEARDATRTGTRRAGCGGAGCGGAACLPGSGDGGGLPGSGDGGGLPGSGGGGGLPGSGGAVCPPESWSGLAAAAGLASGWASLASLVGSQAPWLSAPPPARPGLCAACRIPVPGGNARCYPCAQHAETLPGLLADAVVPICYAVKGSEHARNLWLYKSGRPAAGAARAAIRALLVVFLRDHGRCVWHAAGMTRPTHLAVVPSGRGRRRPHPLLALAAPCITLPLAGIDLRLGDEPGTRELDADRFRAAPADGADVLLLDDTWTTGASAQSACAALRLAGARSVAIVVVGRHVAPAALSLTGPARPRLAAKAARPVVWPAGGVPGSAAGGEPGSAADGEPGSAAAATAIAADRVRAAMPFRPGLCAVHARAAAGDQ